MEDLDWGTAMAELMTSSRYKKYRIIAVVFIAIIALSVIYFGVIRTYANEEQSTTISQEYIESNEVEESNNTEIEPTIESESNTVGDNVINEEANIDKESEREIVPLPATNGEVTMQEFVANISNESIVIPADVNGSVVSYCYAYEAISAPTDKAGIWLGNDYVDDNNYCYFIGHHPGPFDPVIDLNVGDKVGVKDSNGNYAEYSVVDVFDLNKYAYWKDYSERVSKHNESIILQTCLDDGINNRFVVARK